MNRKRDLMIETLKINYYASTSTFLLPGSVYKLKEYSLLINDVKKLRRWNKGDNLEGELIFLISNFVPQANKSDLKGNHQGMLCKFVIFENDIYLEALAKAAIYNDHIENDIE